MYISRFCFCIVFLFVVVFVVRMNKITYKKIPSIETVYATPLPQSQTCILFKVPLKENQSPRLSTPQRRHMSLNYSSKCKG